MMVSDKVLVKHVLHIILLNTTEYNRHFKNEMVTSFNCCFIFSITAHDKDVTVSLLLLLFIMMFLSLTYSCNHDNVLKQNFKNVKFMTKHCHKFYFLVPGWLMFSKNRLKLKKTTTLFKKIKH